MLYLFDIVLGLLLGALFSLNNGDRRLNPYLALMVHLLLLAVPMTAAMWLHWFNVQSGTMLWVYLGISALTLLGFIAFCEIMVYWLWRKLLLELEIPVGEAQHVLEKQLA